ncbi:calcium homeostasis modulator protein 6 [Chanos chanos]|uniref:Calcium homeostasis modulator protein 6 n=1 Tax=Chanos chanos TaxID=29144 RepID=A0A6J2WCV3_CHACN|nr:calcium homeostasis modulator protein 6-like [Chanos chanos]
MATKAMDIVKKINSGPTGPNLWFGLIALITAGGEQGFSSFAFKCPCNDWNFTYGAVSLLVPAQVLLILGYMLHNKTWKLFTGLCRRKSKLCHLGNFTALMQITVTALVAPVTWIAIALLKGEYFECAMTGTNATLFVRHFCHKSSAQCQTELQKFPCGRSTTVSQAEREAVLASIRAQSQVLGWLLIASFIMLLFVLTCWTRCGSPVSYLQLQFWRTYRLKELDLFERQAAARAAELAERNTKSFFELTKAEALRNPSRQAWEKISALVSYSNFDEYYSSLHRYVCTSQDPENPMKRSENSGGIALNRLPSLDPDDTIRMMLPMEIAE